MSSKWFVLPLSLVLPLVAAAGILSGPLSVAASPAAADKAQMASIPASGQGIQVADEIIRQLRRLGLSFNHDRINRPYDPKGELC